MLARGSQTAERIGPREYLDSGVFHLGSAHDVAASLRADPALPHATELIVQVGHLGPGEERTLRSLELFANQVAPELGWVPSHRRRHRDRETV